jgi:hypothetical protein
VNKPEIGKPGEIKPEVSKPEESKPEESQPDESNSEEAHPETSTSTPSHESSTGDSNNNDGTIVSASDLSSSATNGDTIVSWNIGSVTNVTVEQEKALNPTQIGDSTGEATSETVTNPTNTEEVYDVLEVLNVSDISKVYGSYDFTDTEDLANTEYTMAVSQDNITSEQISEQVSTQETEQILEQQSEDQQLSNNTTEIKSLSKAQRRGLFAVAVCATVSVGSYIGLFFRKRK